MHGKIEQHNYSLDLLKGLSICFVLIWHLKPVELVNYGNDFLYIILNSLKVVFMHEISLLAVPTFYLVSLCLFFQKNNLSDAYIKRRTKRLIGIYLFWMLIQSLVFCFVSNKLPAITLNFIMMGGPSLPVVGGSVFYFIFDLIILTLFSHFFFRTGPRSQKVISLIVILLTLLLFEISSMNGFPLKGYALYNFLIYVPISYYLTTKREFFLRRRYISLFLYILFAVHDVLLIKLGYTSTPYGRISIFCGSIAFVSFAMCMKRSQNRIITLLSTYSLGIFAIHKYMQLASLKLIDIGGYIKLQGVGVEIKSLTVFLTACTATFIVVFIIQKSRLRKFVA